MAQLMRRATIRRFGIEITSGLLIVLAAVVVVQVSAFIPVLSR